MTAPRDNESHSGSEWIGRRSSGYYYDDQSNLPSCRFVSQPTECIDERHGSINVRRPFDRYERSESNQNESTPSVLGLYDVSLPCVEPSVCIEELPSFCSQFRDCSMNNTGLSNSRNCQLGGSVDVEDLALYFEPDRSQTNCPPRPYRAAATNPPHFRRFRAKYGEQYPTVDVPSKRLDTFDPIDIPQGNVDLDCAASDWLGEQFCNSCPQNFPFCTDERWLQCPESDRCPLNDTVYDPYALPPCAYEDFRNEYWRYGCNEDEQLLEDYLSNEKRKEKSRDAARCRRSMETDIFTELAAALPVPPDQAAQLDKASVMRLAIAYLKVRSVIESMPAPPAKSETSNEMDELFSKALNGFMLVLSSDGNIIYLSENVSDYLGVSQMDMMGQSVYEYSHPCDHDELRECLASKPNENNDKRSCSFFLRLKCTLTSKGRKVNLKSASYKVIHCIGRLTYIRAPVLNAMETDEEDRKTEKEEDDDEEDERMERDTGASLVLVGCPIPHPSNIEIPLGRHTFLSKHSLSMKFTYADEKLADYLGWNSEELVGQSVFEFFHALDNLALDKSFKSLFSKGQCETVAYRFLGKRGGYAWVVTQATLIHCSKQQKPLSVVCVNYVLSGVEREDEVYSARQLAARDTERNNNNNVVKSKKKVTATVPNIGEIISVQQPAKVKLQVRIDAGEQLEEVRFDAGDHEYASSESAQQQQGLFERAKPLAVTTSTFRVAAGQKAKKEPVGLQDGSRKDNTFPRPVHDTEKSFVGVQALKESLEESLKENDEPKRRQQNRNQRSTPITRTPFVFQGKPAVEYDPTEITVRRDRPQAVTRQLFAPIAAQQQPQQQQQQPEQITCRPPPQTATASIFAPRTEDMNKGFLTFSEDHPGLTMLKDEPEDLTHLAPTPGDVCVPLEDTPFLSDMLDEFILGNDNYCPLLSPGGAGLATELRSADFGDPLKDTELGDSTRNKSLGEPLADSDPFMYGDSPSSPCSIDPNSVSRSLTKYRQSPERSIDSLGSPTGGSCAEGLSEDEMLMLGLSDSIADDELALRAPYIPMSDQDEALDLLISDEMVMWSPPHTTEKHCPKWMIDEKKEQRPSESSLAQLLKTEQIVSRKYNDHGGGLVNPVQVLGQLPRKNTSLDTGGSHWPSKLDRPTKRIHTGSIDAGGIENKRIKCEESTMIRCVSPLGLEDHLLGKQQETSAQKPLSIVDSQLLRRLVSQQTVQRNGPGRYLGDSFTVSPLNPPRQSNNAQMKQGDLEAAVEDEGGAGDAEVEGEGEGDSGGGGGCEGGGRTGNSNNRRRRNDETNRNTERNPGCSSVLMNLLVSGCDDSLMESRNVPQAIPRSLTQPLSVNLDNQMVPQCPNSGGSTESYDQLSSVARKQLPGSYMSDGSLVSPSSPMMSFENFDDYDPSMSSSGLLQVQPDLFGSLLDRNLV